MDLACAAVAISIASNSSLRGPSTWPSSSNTVKLGLRPSAVDASAESAL